ncbi:unnamed protein product [Rhizophagus irregularis]|uniref:Uncharacterized protein n=1 Tax=Rhizophagus irregularis TaxID=588596 RepID=A0A2N1MHF7_9GLOM|nr:hypothetical protein RhiirC2_792351 [Rhizophagus irregularis]CAB4393718.1 unnamed protein product [Rhizophagus irregularis]CAB5392196.1 unnamed protein product [Rhizophagus irregularis]
MGDDNNRANKYRNFAEKVGAGVVAGLAVQGTMYGFTHSSQQKDTTPVTTTVIEPTTVTVCPTNDNTNDTNDTSNTANDTNNTSENNDTNNNTSNTPYTGDDIPDYV